MYRWLGWILLVCVTFGCRAPVPRLRDAFAAAGPTRLAPPATGSYTKPDPYYPGAGGLSPPRATTQPQVGISPAPPYTPAATANRPASSPIPSGNLETRAGTASGNTQPAGRFVAPPIMDVGASPRVRITRESTQGSSFTSLNPRGGMVVTDLSREPSSFVPPTRMLDIGDLPPAIARGPGSIALPGTFGAYPHPQNGQRSVANDAWESRR